jgi:hypothetical protein
MYLLVGPKERNIMSNQRTKKLQALFVAAIFALGIVLTPIVALAEPAPGLDSDSTQGKLVFSIASTKDPTLTVKSVSQLGKKASIYKSKWLTINSLYRLSKKFSDTKTPYKVTRVTKLAGLPSKVTAIRLRSEYLEKIDASAFNGVKASRLTLRIDSEQFSKAAQVKGMLKGYTGKVTLKVPEVKKTKYAKIFTPKNMGISKSKLTIVWI